MLKEVLKIIYALRDIIAIDNDNSNIKVKEIKTDIYKYLELSRKMISQFFKKKMFNNHNNKTIICFN